MNIRVVIRKKYDMSFLFIVCQYNNFMYILLKPIILFLVFIIILKKKNLPNIYLLLVTVTLDSQHNYIKKFSQYSDVKLAQYHYKINVILF